MIDWINAVVPYRHKEPIAAGGVQYIDADGALGNVLPRKLQLRGSHDAGLMIQSSTSPKHRLPGEVDGDFGAESETWSLGDYTHVWISGSPKFLQGHNLFGTSDVVRLVELMAARALDLCGRAVGELDRRRWRSGDFHLTVLDLTEMLEVGDQDEVAALLECAGAHARLPTRRKDHRERHGGTVYLGRHSRRWALKLYSKYDELLSAKKSHQLPRDIERRDELMDYARGCIRAELRLHSMELKKAGLDSGKAWLTRDARKEWFSYMQRIEWKGNGVLPSRRVVALPAHLRATYALWETGLCGATLLSVMRRATYFRHRKQLLDFGIDITSACEKERAQVVPLIRLIEARPKAIPQWAYNTPLLAA